MRRTQIIYYIEQILPPHAICKPMRCFMTNQSLHSTNPGTDNGNKSSSEFPDVTNDRSQILHNTVPTVCKLS